MLENTMVLDAKNKWATAQSDQGIRYSFFAKFDS